MNAAVLSLPAVTAPRGRSQDGACADLLSVAELQAALRTARSARSTPRIARPEPLPPVSRLQLAPSATAGRLVAVVAAHGGAGASTTVLAIAASAAATGRAVQVIEWCLPARSGLVAAADSELGELDEGGWRRGRRGTAVVVDRPGERVPTVWPPPPQPGCLRLVDLGLADEADGCIAVLVCRATVPGIRLAERALSRMDRPAALAVVGSRSWPGSVVASAGEHVRRMRGQGRVVAVPLDRRLAVDGPTSDPLPKRVQEAGARLLALVDAEFPDMAPAVNEGAAR